MTSRCEGYIICFKHKNIQLTHLELIWEIPAKRLKLLLMIDIAIQVENLGKRYHRVVGYKTLRDSLANALLAPFHLQQSVIHELSASNN